MKTMKRIISGLLALMMVIAILPITPMPVSATGDDGTACAISGCGGTYQNGFCSICDGYQEPSHYLDGSNTTVFLLYNAGNLYWFANYVNTDEYGPLANARLEADIVVNPKVLNEDGELAVPASQLRSWTPISSLSIAESSYRGTLDGNYHSISGLYCVTDNGDGAGLFANLQVGSQIFYLAILDSYFEAKQADTPAGAFAALSLGGNISNCYNGATVRSVDQSGGIMGIGSGTTMRKCVNAGKVVVHDAEAIECGGIIGGNALNSGETVNLNNCINIGPIIDESPDGGSGLYKHIGALAGNPTYHQILRCYYDPEMYPSPVGKPFIEDEYTIEFVEARPIEDFRDGTICGIIGHNYGWAHTETEHMYACRLCGALESASAYHQIEDCSVGGRCDFCGYLITPRAHVCTDSQCDICRFMCFNHSFGQDNKCTECGTAMIPVTEIQLHSDMEVIQGEQIPLEATVLPDNASFQDIQWYVVKNGIEEPVSGTVRASEAGIMTIRAKIENGTGVGVPYVQDFQISVTAVEPEFDLAFGDIQIEQSAAGKVQITHYEGMAYLGNIASQIEIDENTPILIGGSTTQHKIEVLSGNVNLVLDNLSIDYTEVNQSKPQNWNPVVITPGAAVNMTLAGENTVTANNYYTAFQVNAGASLTIGGNGSLNARGGSAGGGAGIGGFWHYDNDRSCGSITINSGTVVAESWDNASAIGAALDGDVEKIVINGGTVTAISHGRASGIGAHIGNAGTIEIHGGLVFATGGENGAGIGTGSGNSNEYGTAANLTITGGTVVAIGTGMARGIGAGWFGNNGTTTITGGNVYAIGNSSPDFGNIGGDVVNGNGQALKLFAVTLKNLDGSLLNGTVTAISESGYSLKDTQTYNGMVHLYLPENTTLTSVSVDDVVCYGKIENGEGDYYPSHTCTSTIPATCLDLAVCDICGYTYGDLDPTNHASEEFVYSLNQEDGEHVHDKFHKCCNVSAGTEPHNLVDGRCSLCGYVTVPSQDTDGSLLLWTPSHLKWFADQVNSGNTGLNAKMMASIDMTTFCDTYGSVFIGTEDYPYQGTFNGNGMKLTVNLTLSDEHYAAPFRVVDSATIRNLTVDGTIQTNSSNNAGLIGRSNGNTVVEKCIINVNLSISGNVTQHAGIVAVVNSGTVAITDSAFTGSISAASGGIGGFIYWLKDSTSATIENCYMTGTFNTSTTFNLCTFTRYMDLATITNSYYIDSLPDDSEGATPMTAEQFASGEVAYLLGSAWGQEIGVDPYPVVDGMKVYMVTNCAGKTAYNNADEDLGHDYKDGICTVCGELESDAAIIASGWSDATKWALTEDGVLTIYGQGNMENYGYDGSQPWLSYADQITSVVIKEGVTAIGSGAFMGLTALESVTLPDTGLKTIGEAAFYGCTSLKNLYIPDTVYTVWEYTFKDCTALTEVRLPRTLIKIAQGAFENCTALTYIFIPGDTDIIGKWSFKGCTALKEVDMQWADATEIREGAFKNCSALTKIYLPSDIQILGDSCFYGIGAKVFTVPETVTIVGPWCFARASLTEINFSGDAPTIGEGAFNKITLTAFYPGDNATWTAEIMQNYGGTVTWKVK